jgi:hypothetical protein
MCCCAPAEVEHRVRVMSEEFLGAVARLLVNLELRRIDQLPRFTRSISSINEAIGARPFARTEKRGRMVRRPATALSDATKTPHECFSPQNHRSAPAATLAPSRWRPRFQY